MKIYIDQDFKCHVKNDGTMTEAQTDFFNGKCRTFVDGYRFIPDGQTWTTDDGTIVHGEAIFPWKPYSELDAAQREYERELAEAARILLGEVGT